MKKKVLLTVAAAMAVTSVAFASPLTNYDKGSLAIDLNTSISPEMESGGTVDAKSRLGAGITYGIGNKMALQYNYSDNKSKSFPDWFEVGSYDADGFATAQVTGHQLNVLYQINPNVSAFAGLTRSKLKYSGSYVLSDGSGPIGTLSASATQTENGYQVGFIGQTQLSEKLDGWALISAGNRVNAFEIGLGYEVAKNTDFNVFYRQTKYKDFGVDESVDVKMKGLGAGLTFKF